MAEFAGWAMPIQYTSGSIEEHRLVRQSAGLFDVSHMGQIIVRGDGSAGYLDELVSSPIRSLAENQSAYGLLCLPSGGVIDDVFVYRLAGEWLVVVNASNAERDFQWFRDHLPGSGVEIEDASARYAMFAFQGPLAIGVMDTLCAGDSPAGSSRPAVSTIERFWAARLTIAGVQCIIGRTGYTGEDGVEVFAPASAALNVWEAVLAAAAAAGVACGPIGLAARDSLRFEPGFPLYGHELTEDISPVQARLKWACDLEKDFIGAPAIREQAASGVSPRLATVRLEERGVPRQDYPVLQDGTPVGTVASGMYCPTVDAYCANVYVPAGLAGVGTKLDIEIRGSMKPAVVVKRPLYKPAYR